MIWPPNMIKDEVGWISRTSWMIVSPYKVVYFVSWLAGYQISLIDYIVLNKRSNAITERRKLR